MNKEVVLMDCHLVKNGLRKLFSSFLVAMSYLLFNIFLETIRTYLISGD